jgi:hypothetical protein
MPTVPRWSQRRLPGCLTIRRPSTQNIGAIGRARPCREPTFPGHVAALPLLFCALRRRQLVEGALAVPQIYSLAKQKN